MKIKKSKLKKAIRKAVRDPKNQKMLEAGQFAAVAGALVKAASYALPMMTTVVGALTGIAGSGTKMKYKK